MYTLIKIICKQILEIIVGKGKLKQFIWFQIFSGLSFYWFLFHMSFSFFSLFKLLCKFYCLKEKNTSKHMAFNFFWHIMLYYFFKKFLLLFNYSCMPFLPIPPTHGQNQGGGWRWGREVGSM